MAKLPNSAIAMANSANSNRSAGHLSLCFISVCNWGAFSFCCDNFFMDELKVRCAFLALFSVRCALG